jgi:hypothetical protein
MAQYSPSTAAKGYAASFINALYYVYPNASADVTAFDYQLKATSLQWLYTGVWSTPTQPPVTDQAQLDAFVQNLLAKERLAGSTVPILSASKSVSGFVASQGVASAAKMLYVSAANVVGNVVVEVPAGFEASTDGINFQPSVAVVPVAGQLLSAPVYVRLSSFATAGAIQGTAVVSASGVASRLVALSAQVSGNAFERVADTYTGIFGSGILDSSFVAKNGLFSLTTRTDGSFSGSVSVGGAKYAFTGLFTDPGQPITVSVPRKKQTPITLALDFDTQRPTHRITGTVTIDSSVSTLVALPKIFTSAPGAIHPKSGKRYNIVLPAADPTLAHGFATLSVAANGAVSLTGRLGDGTAFSAPTVAIDGDNDEIPGYWIVPAYAAPYGAGGCLVGEFYIAKNEAAVQPDVSGNFGWVRPASSRAKLFPAGFRYALSPLGQAYAVTPNVSLISGSGVTAPFTLKFDQSAKVLASPLGQIGSWPASNVPALVAPVQSGLTFAFTGGTGAFSGALKIKPTSKKATLFDGLMLSQKIQLPGSLTPIYGVGIMVGPTGVAELEIGD